MCLIKWSVSVCFCPTLSITERTTVASSSFNSMCYHSALYSQWGRSEIQKQQPSSCFEFPTAKENTHHASLIILFACHAFPLFLLTFTQFLSVLPPLTASAVSCVAFFGRTISFTRDHFVHLHTVGCPSALSYFFFPIPSLWMSRSLFEFTIRLINNLYSDVLKGVSAPWFAGGVLCNNVPAIYISIGEMVIAQQYSA